MTESLFPALCVLGFRDMKNQKVRTSSCRLDTNVRPWFPCPFDHLWFFFPPLPLFNHPQSPVHLNNSKMNLLIYASQLCKVGAVILLLYRWGNWGKRDWTICLKSYSQSVIEVGLEPGQSGFKALNAKCVSVLPGHHDVIFPTLHSL